MKRLFTFLVLLVLVVNLWSADYNWTYTTTTQTLDGTARKTAGTFAFTGAGTIAGGTVIDEVPGITMTVGASGDSWSVVNATSLDGSYNLGAAAAYCSTPAARPAYTSGCFFKFVPIVNGELKVKYYTLNTEIYYSVGNVPGDRQSGNRIQEKTFMLEAGKTYYLGGKGGGFYLNSYTFRPVFFNPSTTTDQLTLGNFDATIGSPAKDGFPKLIDPTSTSQQDNVKFSGNKSLVYLYKNNDVELLGKGDGILIRGTVLDKNGDDGLVAYYYLNSNILEFKSDVEFEDQAYIDITDINNYGSGTPTNTYAFKNANNYGMALTENGTITVQKDADNPYAVTPTFSTNAWEMYVPVTLEEGATYRITIPAGSVKEKDVETGEETGALNAEIVRTFTVKKDGELELKMIYPTEIATVGTAIVLETYLNGSTSGINLDTKKHVKCVLSAEGEDPMTLDAIISTNQLAFKPTSVLKPNTTYTLTYTYNADNNVIITVIDNNVTYAVTHSKVFTFKTGSASGTEPQLVSTTPREGAKLDASTTYSSGTISFTFDQTVDLEPYSTVNATPINGSEATADGVTRAPEGTGNTLTVGDDGKTVSFDYTADGLKYDLYYEVVIPVNTVVGAGGTPNSEPITLHFKMGKNPNATEVNAETFYPHTWDFCKFGKNEEGTTSYNIKNYFGHGNSSKINNLKRGNGDGYTIYTSDSQTGYGWDQGNDVYFNYKNGNYEKPDEFEGIRISLVKSTSNRFELRNITSKDTDTKNADGSDKWVFRMNGNTHYMTLSNVPAGKLYMVVNSPYVGINSPNATFVESDNYTLSNNNTLLKTSGTRKVVINVTEAGDVSFCVKNFNCEKIGVTPTYKSFNDWDGKGYSTEWRDHTERYDLTNCFTDYSVTAEAVTAYSKTSDDGTGTLTLFPVEVADAETPVIVTCTTTGATEVPLFATDVNTATTTIEGTNYLEGNTGTTSIYAPKGSYIMTTKFYNTDSEGNIADGAKLNTGDLGFYKVVKDNFNTVGVNKAYLRLPASASSAKGFMFIYDDSETTMIENTRISSEQGASEVFNLQGQRVAKPERGIYIKNGKKFYVK